MDRNNWLSIVYFHYDGCFYYTRLEADIEKNIIFSYTVGPMLLQLGGWFNFVRGKGSSKATDSLIIRYQL